MLEIANSVWHDVGKMKISYLSAIQPKIATSIEGPILYERYLDLLYHIEMNARWQKKEMKLSYM